MGIEQKLGHPSDLIHLGHLLGHMLGCNHTTNAQCGRVGSSAFEPGSGSSLMSSAGYCSPNIQDIGDAYFHIHNLTEIHHFLLNGPGAGCGDDGAISYNQDPVSITHDHDVYLPPATPIRLYPLTATDPDGPSLTYCWEQYNLGPAGHRARQVELPRSFEVRIPQWMARASSPISRILSGKEPPG